MESIQFIEATSKDFSGIRELMLSALKSDPTAFSSDYEDYANCSDPWWQNYLFGYITKNNAKMFLALSDNNLAGMVGLLYDTRNRHKHVASVVWFYVKPEYRSKGIGTQLLQMMITEIKNNGFTKAVLLVNAPQQQAINLYKTLGFNIVGTLKSELKINNQMVDEHIMELFL